MISLNTKSDVDGEALTFADGRPAGKVVWLAGIARARFISPDGMTGAYRRTFDAARYDALAWAADAAVAPPTPAN